MLRDLHALPKVRDSWSYLYVEHAKVDREDKAIAVTDKDGTVSIPCASLTTLLLGPGTNVTHAAVAALAASGCTVCWVGEDAVRFYAQGMGETRAAHNLVRQARLWAHPTTRQQVVERMYRVRFVDPLEPDLTLEQIRGKEGIRVREAYARASRRTGVEWRGRSYDRGAWYDADPVNRALSAANSCLYGVCHAAVVSAGYSPSIGFVHTGKMLSFVYDVADLYKVDVTVPAAFEAAREGPGDLERRVRKLCRERFHETRLLQRIVPDVERVLYGTTRRESEPDDAVDEDAALPGDLWDPAAGSVPGGVNHAGAAEERGEDEPPWS